MSNVVDLPLIHPRRAAQMQLALDAVSVAVGYAAGTVKVLYSAYHSERAAQRRLEELRREWHLVVDDAIRWALTEGESA